MMNMLDKQSPNAASGTNSSAPPPISVSGPITSSSVDCLISNSQLIPSLAAGPQPPSTGPSSVSSSSAPQTPIDTLNSVNCQSDLTSSNGQLSNRPNVSTPSSVFNSSAPNTPMPCPSVGSDANITSPALNHQLDYGEPKMFTPNSAPPSQTLPNSGNIGNPVLSPSPLNVPPPPMCVNENKKTMNNGSAVVGNKKHCNNRNQASNFSSIKGENASNVLKNQTINFPPATNMPNMPPCNGSHLNGSVSPFDADNKMSPFIKNEFVNDFSASIPNEMVSSMSSNSSNVGGIQRPPPNCSSGMNVSPMMPNIISNSGSNNKICGNNMPAHSMVKPPPMDSQYMQHQSQIFVFSTGLANQAADGVDSGQFDSIIDFHLANPLTKNFVEKNNLKPNLKINNPWQCGNRLPRMRMSNPNGMCPRGTFNNNPCISPYNHNPPGPGPGGGPQWNGPMNNWSAQPPGPIFHPNDMDINKISNCGARPYGLNLMNAPPHMNNSHYPQGDMQDLTPQQKQHREKQLAILANLQQKYCPELMESHNRPLSQPPQSNEFANIDPNNSNQVPSMLPENELNQMIPSDFNSTFPANSMVNSQPHGGGGDQWQKSSSFPDEKPFTGGVTRRKGSQLSNQASMTIQSPMPQPINSPNSCIALSPGNRVPPPPYNQGVRSISSPHPASPAGASLSLPSPRMHLNDTRQSSYTPGGARSGPATPSAENSSCLIINSPKSSSRSGNSNSSPGNKKAKQQQQQQQQQQQSSMDNELNLTSSFSNKLEPSLMPVPSPKQIDYINTFEGHELTIHKQPNAHFQEGEIVNSNDLNNDLFSNDFVNLCSSSVNNPSVNMSDMNPNSRFPANSCNFDGNPKFSGMETPNRYNNNFGSDGMRRPTNICPPHFNPNDAPNSMGDLNFANNLPPIGHDGAPFPNGDNHVYPEHPDNTIGSTHLQNLQKMTPPFDIANKDGMMPNTKSLPPNLINSMNNHMNSVHPNIPQNPNHRMPNFGPQFPNMPCNDLNEPNNFHQPNMSYPNNFGSSPRMPSNIPEEPPFNVHQNSSHYNLPMNAPLDQSNPNGPNPMSMMPTGPQANLRYPSNVTKPLNPPNTQGARYNSPNIQVKQDAPNTIQYMPSRPQGPTNTPPSRPPNLDFLQQSLNMSNKLPHNHAPYPPFQNSSGPMAPMPPRSMQGHMNFNRGPMMRPLSGPMANQPTMLPQPNMFGRPPAPSNMMGNCGPQTSNISGPPNNFGPSPSGQVTSGKTATTTTTVPNMHTESFLKNSDPAYAAQYHNFQQQLYATNTRNSTNSRVSHF